MAVSCRRTAVAVRRATIFLSVCAPYRNCREFITRRGGGVAARGARAAAGQAADHRAWVAAFVQRLRELGWIEGCAVTIEYRWGEGRAERFTEIAAELVRLKVDSFSPRSPHRSLVLRTESATGAADVHVRFSVDLVKYISICKGG
jgi:hypothetical protein